MAHEPINPFRPPASPDVPQARGSDEYATLQERLRGDTRGRRVAGIFLLANAALATVTVFVAGMRTSPFGIGLDFLAGFLLVRGFGDAAKIALFRIVLAVFLSVTAGLAADTEVAGRWDALVLNVPVAVGLILLVVGNPGKARFAAGSVLLAVVLAAHTAIVLLLATGET
jgi:hypothetical protein